MRTVGILAATAVTVAAAGLIWTKQSSGSSASFRGLSVVDSKVAWVGGTGGAILRTTDGGSTWTPRPVPGADGLDFRDIEAFDAQRAVVLASGLGSKSRIYLTMDGGEHWRLSYQESEPGGFLDAIAFWDERRGLALGDPVRGKFTLLETSDGGASWRAAPAGSLPAANESEGAFAASGTCLVVAGRGRAWFGTGGVNGGRIFRSTDWGRQWNVVETPIRHDSASSGIFSIAFQGEHGVAVGGDYQKPDQDQGNLVITEDGGRIWKAAEASRPSGYRSAVVFSRGAMLATGTNGTDRSVDGGRTWKRETEAAGFNSIRSFGAGGWAVGPNGKIARFQ